MRRKESTNTVGSGKVRNWEQKEPKPPVWGYRGAGAHRKTEAAASEGASPEVVVALDGRIGSHWDVSSVFRSPARS